MTSQPSSTISSSSSTATPSSSTTSNETTRTTSSASQPTTSAASTQTTTVPPSSSSSAAQSSAVQNAGDSDTPSSASSIAQEADSSTEVVTATTTLSSTVTAPLTEVMTTEIPTTGANGQPTTITSLVTITGETTYLTVQATTVVGPGSSLNTQDDAAQTGFFNNTGAVAGTFLAVGILICGLVLGGLLFVRRRKRRRALDEDLRVAAGGAGDGGAGTSRFHDDIEDDDFLDDPSEGGGGGGGSTGAGFKGPPMSQYNPLSLPAGAAAAGAAGGYYGNQSSQGHSGGGHSRTLSGSSNFMGGMAAAGAGAGAYGAGQFSRQQSSAPSYYTGNNQAYQDQYGIAQNYADRNNGPFSDYPNERYSGDGSGESGGGHARRESECVPRTSHNLIWT